MTASPTFSIVLATVLGVSWLSSAALGSQDASRSPLRQSKTDVEMAMARTGEIVAALRASDWDTLKIDRALLRLPERVTARYPQDQKREGLMFCLPLGSSSTQIYDGQVATYTDLFVRRTLTKIVGKEGVLKTEGFFIVGWVDGRVEKIPVEQIRLLPDGDEMWRWVFPGMRQYRTSLMRLEGTSPLAAPTRAGI